MPIALVLTTLLQAAPADGAAGQEVGLHTIANRAIGFTIDAPADARTVQCDQQRCELVAVLPRGGVLSVAVERGTAPLPLDQAVAFTKAQGALAVVEQEQLRSGHVLLVAAPGTAAQDVWYFYNSSRSPLRVRCQAPPRLKPRCEQIARSLRAMYVPPAPSSAPASAPASLPTAPSAAASQPAVVSP